MLNVLQQHRPDRVRALACRLSASRGNTITEYALIGILVVVVCIVALQTLGSGLNSAMAMVRQNMKNHQLQASAALMAQKSAASGLAGQNGQLTAAQQALLQESLAQKLQTTGANGATEILADQLAATAALLLAQGQITQSQYDILMQLANQGHKMAQIETMVNQAVQMANGDYTAFSNMKFTFDGQTYTAPELSGLLGFNGPTPYYFANNGTLNSAVANTADPELATFLSLYNQALSSGALSNPLALSTVNSAASQIAALGELTESVSPEMQRGDITTAADAASLQVSQATQMNSSQICTAGNFQDNGVLCTP